MKSYVRYNNLDRFTSNPKPNYLSIPYCHFTNIKPNHVVWDQQKKGMTIKMCLVILPANPFRILFFFFGNFKKGSIAVPTKIKSVVSYIKGKKINPAPYLHLPSAWTKTQVTKLFKSITNEIK